MKCVRCKIEIDNTEVKNTSLIQSTICVACENFYDASHLITCKTCSTPKPTTEYYGAVNTRTGYETSCKSCKKLSDAEKYKKRKERKKKLVQDKNNEFSSIRECGIECRNCKSCEVSNYVFPDNTQSSKCWLNKRPIQFIKIMVE